MKVKMPPHNILQSIELDTAQSLCGFPHIAPGKQPNFPLETSESSKLPTVYLQEIIEQLNHIFQVTGCPVFPSLIIGYAIAAALTVILIFYVDDYSYLLWIPWVVFGASPSIIINVYQCKRRQRLHRALKQWNNSVGMDHGVYLLLGLDDQISAWNFWKSSGPCCQRGKPHLQLCEGMDETNELNMNSCGCRC